MSEEQQHDIPTPPPLTDRERLLRLEFAMWGASGSNGVVGGVKDIKDTLDNMRDQEIAGLGKKLDTFRNVVLTVGTTLLLVAGGLVASGGIHVG